MAAPTALTKGSRVWVHTAGEGWRLGTLAAATAADGGAAVVALDCSLGEGAGAEVTAPLASLEPANPALLDGVRRAGRSGCMQARRGRRCPRS